MRQKQAEGTHFPGGMEDLGGGRFYEGADEELRLNSILRLT